MYSIDHKSGAVVRIVDGVVVAPAQSTSDPAYIEYVNWCSVGNTPSIVSEALADVKVAQIGLINDACEIALRAVVSGYSSLEIATWDTQAVEATAYAANPTAASAPMLTQIAAKSNITLSNLVKSVNAKSTLYKTASGAMVGKKQSLVNAINSCTTIDAVRLIVW